MDTKRLVEYAVVIEKHDGSAEWFDAVECVASAFERLVYKTIYNVFGSSVRYHKLFDDLVQEGKLGLVDACVRITAEKCGGFATYVGLRVLNAVIPFWNDFGLHVRVSKRDGELAKRMLREGRGADGKLLELKKMLLLFRDCQADRVTRVWELLGGGVVPIDNYGEEHGCAGVRRDTRLQDAGFEDAWITGERDRILREALNMLSVRDRDILLLRYGFVTGEVEPRSAISEKLGCTSRVAVLAEKRALKKLASVAGECGLFL